MAKRKPIINVHCHLFNFKFIPDKVSKLLSHIPENIAEDKWFSVAAGFLTSVIPGGKFDRIKKFLKIYRSDIDKVTKEYVKEMDRAGIDICTPLMMDLEKAVDDESIKGEYTEWKDQIELISKEAAKYPWRIFPFVMFDPRKGNALTLCKHAIEEKGFIGVKIYPALGYFPSPKDMPAGNTNGAERLKELYEYCRDRKIPITTHASTGGAYSTKADNDREGNVWPLTEVANWLDPLLDYKLKLNLAHLGGNYLNIDSAKRVQSATWRREILKFIARSKNEEDLGDLYSDLAFHDMALKVRTRRRYFKDLRSILESEEYGSRILFGTDASMISHTWTEKEYIKPFKKNANLNTSLQEKIFSDNPTSFLFDDGQIPESYCTFLKNNADPQSLTSLPDWIKKENDKYFIVS